ALVSLLVTVADITVGNIGAAFWGLLAGLLVAWLLERPDFIPEVADTPEG
ncbi:MAG: benzoate transporter, partial [Methylobacterium sp.]